MRMILDHSLLNELAFHIEPGDENALLRHVAYITGLPKEIQNETLAEVFGAACGPIAPVSRRAGLCTERKRSI